MKFKTYRMTERDQKILISLFKNKVLSLKQIREYFFKGSHPTYADKRMRILCYYKYAKKQVHILDDRLILIYSLTPKGLNLIKEYLPINIHQNRYKSDSIIHDLQLASISLHLKDFRSISQIFYESELQSSSDYSNHEELRAFVNLRSDRVLEIKGEEENIFLALENERTLKEKSRYLEKFKDYYAHKKILGVLYICSDDSIIKSLMKIDTEVCTENESKFYFVNISEASKESDKITFKNNLGQTLELLR